MRDKMRREYQRSLNRFIRSYNKAIEKDELWKGRFVARQINMTWHKFDDGSGGTCFVIIRCFDKKTRQYSDYTFDYAPWRSTLHWHFGMDILNTFIVETLDVWKNEDPRNEVQDYTSVVVPSDAGEKEYMFWGQLGKY